METCAPGTRKREGDTGGVAYVNVSGLALA